MTDLFCIALAAAGFAMLAAAMDRHQRDVIGRKLPRLTSRRFRAGGAAALAATLLAGVATSGAAIGVVAWFGHLTIGAAIVLTWLCWNTARKKSPNKTGLK